MPNPVIEHDETAIFTLMAQQNDVLLIGDHASNRVPDDINLGIDAQYLDQHIAVDIGAAGVADALVAQFGFSSIACNFSRLVADCNRRADEAEAVNIISDGVAINGNMLTPEQRVARLDRFYWRYHRHVSAAIERAKPRLLIFLHSFTPQLSENPLQHRPWELGMMYDQDRRAADIAMPLLVKAGFKLGDQLPYSGVVYNSSLQRHGERTGTPYCGLEMRQDLITYGDQQAAMAQKLGPIFRQIIETLA